MFSAPLMQEPPHTELSVIHLRFPDPDLPEDESPS